MKTSHRLLLLALTAVVCVRLSEPATGATASVPGTLTAEDLATLRSGDARRLETALDRGVSVHARDVRGNTPLMLATLYGDVTAMRLLLRRGAEVDATNAAGATALMRAAVDAEKVRLLLEHGAAPNARSTAGNTPLLLAARPARSYRAVQLLLDRGADARATNRYGASTLMAAAAGGDADSVRLLLRHGADPNARPAFDQAGFLFGGGRSPLMWAAFRGDLTVMNLLVDAGADVNLPGLYGTALAQATWADRREAAEWLVARGANPRIAGIVDGYTPLHWAASSELGDPGVVRLLLGHGADPNQGGGESVDAFLGTPQTPLMLARRRGETAVVKALRAGGATNETPDRPRAVEPRTGRRAETIDADVLRAAIGEAVAPLQRTSLKSKESFVNHASRQDCTSCHQQHLPLAAVGLARRFEARVDRAAEQALVRLVQEGEIKDPEIDAQPLFHPDPVMTKGYELLAYALEDLAADENADLWVHHLAAVQGPEGQWYNNLPRPPIQTGDIGATALAIHALRRYPLPGRAAEIAQRVDRARGWLWGATAEDTDSRIYQLLGLAWAGESPARLADLAGALVAEQRADGGWGQLPGLPADAYATGQALYALRVAAGRDRADAAVDKGIRFLLETQLADGTWYVRRRAFPFQPTMNSGFPHGRDSWISAAGTSWAVMALSLPESSAVVAKTAGGRSLSAP
jgi:ankyrin repeat protein